MRTSLAKILAATAPAMLLPLLCACGKDDPQPEPLQGPARRTVLVYGAAFNSLSSDLGNDMDEMRQGFLDAGADADSCRWLLYRWDYASDLPGLWELRREGKAATWVKLKEYDKSRLSTDPERMARVIDDAAHLAPARDYGLILWSHASGWMPARHADKYSFGDDSSLGSDHAGRFMNITDLAQAIPRGRFSFIWADCCHMGGIEVAYKLRGHCDRYVAYPTEVISDGIPYQLMLPQLMRPQTDIEEAARTFFGYWDKRGGISRSATISVTRTDRLPALAAACRALMHGKPTPPATDVQVYHRRATGLGPYYDLLDLCRAYAAGNVADPAYMAVADALSQTVTYAATTDYFLELRIDPTRYCGLSSNLYSPTDNTAGFYRTYQWYKDVLE